MPTAPKDPILNLQYRREVIKLGDTSRLARQEILMAAERDPVWFIDTFLFGFNPKDHPAAPERPFITYKFQEELSWKMHRAIGVHDLVIPKSRAVGGTYIILANLFHRWLFWSMQSFLLASAKEDRVDNRGDPSCLFWKALTLDTPVLTPSGWASNGSLCVGDLVIGSAGTPVPITRVVDHGKRLVYRVEFSDGTWVRCCGDHQWTVINKHGERVTRTTHQMLRNYRYLVRTRGTWRYRYKVPLMPAVKFQGQGPLPLPPYLLGSLLGDGSLSKNTPELCSVDGEIIDRAASEVPGECLLRQNSPKSWAIKNKSPGGRSGAHLPKILSLLGLRGKRAWEKFVPQQYLLASPEDRLEVLRGLMDTDGWVQLKSGDRSDAFFETTSRQLAQDVAFLVRSLGGIANEPRSYPRTFRYKGERRHGRRAYRLGIVLPVNPFFMKRKADNYRPRAIRDKAIVSITECGYEPVRCLTVGSGDHLYAVHGFNLTHNCDHFLNCLPAWMRPDHDRVELKLENLRNGSIINGESTNNNIDRGGRRTAILADEAAAMREAAKIASSIQYVTNSCIWLSTFQGAFGGFYDLYEKYSRENPDWVVRLHWSQHPVYSQGMYVGADGKPRSPWYDTQCLRAVGPRWIAQELDMDPMAAGGPFFEGDLLTRLLGEGGTIRQPVTTGDLKYDEVGHSPRFLPGTFGRLLIWCPLDKEGEPPSGDYVIGCDIATGKGGEQSSQSTASVVNKLTGEKVAEYKYNMITPTNFAKYVVALANWFHGAKLIWGSQGLGDFGATIQRECRYGRVWTRPNGKPGFPENPDSKYELLCAYRESLACGRFVNRSKAAVEECRQFIYANGTVEHSRAIQNDQDPENKGRLHGDIVIADAMANHLLPLDAPARRAHVGNLGPAHGTFAWRMERAEALSRRKDEWADVSSYNW